MGVKDSDSVYVKAIFNTPNNVLHGSLRDVQPEIAAVVAFHLNHHQHWGLRPRVVCVAKDIHSFLFIRT